MLRTLKFLHEWTSVVWPAGGRSSQEFPVGPQQKITRCFYKMHLLVLSELAWTLIIFSLLIHSSSLPLAGREAKLCLLDLKRCSCGTSCEDNNPWTSCLLIFSDQLLQLPHLAVSFLLLCHFMIGIFHVFVIFIQSLTMQAANQDEIHFVSWFYHLFLMGFLKCQSCLSFSEWIEQLSILMAGHLKVRWQRTNTQLLK